MQIHSLKSMVGVSITALVFFGSALGSMAQQNVVPMLKDNKPQDLYARDDKSVDLDVKKESAESEKMDSNALHEKLSQMLGRSELSSEEMMDDEDLSNTDEMSLAAPQEQFEGQMTNQSSASTNMKVITPKLVAVPMDDDLPQPQPDDSTDPTSEGDRKEGRKKGMRLHPANFPLIPIIRMGENYQESKGLTVIKGWGS